MPKPLPLADEALVATHHTAGVVIWRWLVILALIVAVAFVVYITGGIAYVYAHGMYVPIILAAWWLGVPGGVAAGALGGFALGPFMPILVESGVTQSTANWLFRLAIFVGIGWFSGWVRLKLLHQLYHNIQLARTDASTLLPNAAGFLHHAEGRIQRARGEGHVVLVLVIGNEQELVNTFGAAAGDKVLTEIADRIAENLPGIGQTPAILRSREIGVMVQTSESPRELAARVRSMILEPIAFQNFALYADVAIGAARMPDHGHSVESLLSRARIAAAVAEARGSGYEVYNRELDRTSRENLSLLGELPAAIQSGQISLHYQPKIFSYDWSLAGLEGLIRWNHPKRGWVPPDAFIGQVEDTKLVDQLTEWVLREAARQARLWRDQGIELPVAVNVSARNLHRPDMVYLVDHCLEVENLSPDALELEVTERALMHDVDVGLRTLERLGKLGVRLYIDDYGTGHCSLAYLKQLPVHALKIDRTFVAGMQENERDLEIVGSTSDLCHRLGLDCVAEGVESVEIIRRLAEMKVDYCQGYGICHPADAGTITGKLHGWSQPA